MTMGPRGDPFECLVCAVRSGVKANSTVDAGNRKRRGMSKAEKLRRAERHSEFSQEADPGRPDSVQSAEPSELRIRREVYCHYDRI